MEQNEMIESVTGMVVSLAARAWKSLPCDVQVWLSIQDLMQIGTRELLRYASYWDPSRGASWSTYAYRLLHDTYVNEIRRYYQPKYRPILPYQEISVGGSLYDQYDAYRAVFRAASRELRGWLRRAVGVPVGLEDLPFAPVRSFRVSFSRRLDLSEEMSRLCRRYRFTLQDARELQGDASGEYLNRENRDVVQPMQEAL